MTKLIKNENYVNKKNDLKNHYDSRNYLIANFNEFQTMV